MKAFHTTLILMIIVAVATSVYILFQVSPYENGEIKAWALFLLLFCVLIAISCTISLLSYPIRHYMQPALDERMLTRIGLRQGAWVGIGVVFLLYLSMTNTLNFVTGGLTVASLVALEYFFN